MATQASIVFVKNQFVATLADGRCIQQTDLHELAEALFRAGVHAGDIQYEWSAGQRMITAGQQVALRAAIRRKEPQPPATLAIAA